MTPIGRMVGARVLCDVHKTPALVEASRTRPWVPVEVHPLVWRAWRWPGLRCRVEVPGGPTVIQRPAWVLLRCPSCGPARSIRGDVEYEEVTGE